MYEEIAPRRSGAFRDVFLLIVFGFLLLSLPSWLEKVAWLPSVPLLLPIYEFSVILFMSLLIVRLIRKYAVEYTYHLREDLFFVCVKSAKRMDTVFEIRMTSEMVFLPYFEGGKELIEARNRNVRKISLGVADLHKAYVVSASGNPSAECIVFQPSEKFVEILLQKPLDKAL